jgi:predicted SnoaL-like aldol condensation-catalyzing enzyme
MSDVYSNKQTIQDLIQTVWHRQDLVALKDFWAEDRFQDGKIAEHWSVADMAGLMQQLQA